jgi:hypothetical protein
MKRILLGIVVATLALLTTAAAGAQGDNYTYCPGSPQTRLASALNGVVTPGLPNVIRSQPWQGSGSQILGEIPAGGIFALMQGYTPQCSNGMLWYYVSYNGIVGWTPEGSNYGEYWTAPYSGYVDNGNLCSLSPRLSIGGSGIVTPGLPNVIRTEPNKSPFSSIVASIPAGGVFTVLDGPVCGDRVLWWLVNYNGSVGWTGEGENFTYWTEPFSGGSACPLPTRLYAGGWGYVLPGLPNRLRADPTQSARQIGRLPAGATFSVLSGPVCSEGVYWWQVNYRGRVGWTAEGSAREYWIAPY